MKILQKICFVFLLGTFSSVYGGSCWDKVSDIVDCRVKAERGDAIAQFNLGVMYAEGQGVPQDYVMAHMYFNIAPIDGYEDAVINRGIVEEEMTASQILEAQKLAREWMRTHQ
jgi:TPR repeat protein